MHKGVFTLLFKLSNTHKWLKSKLVGNKNILITSINLPDITGRTALAVGPDVLKAKYHVITNATQPDSHYIRYTAASVLRSTTLSTPEGHWLMCAW